MMRRTVFFIALTLGFLVSNSLYAQDQELTADEQAALILMQAQLENPDLTQEQRDSIVIQTVQNYPNLQNRPEVPNVNVVGNVYVAGTLLYVVANGDGTTRTLALQPSSIPDAANVGSLVANLVSKGTLSANQINSLVNSMVTLSGQTSGGTATSNAVAQSIVNALKTKNISATIIADVVKSINNTGGGVMVTSPGSTTSLASLL